MKHAGFDFPLLTKPVHPRTMLAHANLCLKPGRRPLQKENTAAPVQMAS